MTEKVRKGDFKVSEGIMGTFHYHLSKGESLSALCGAPVMSTNIPLSAWGVKTLDGHIREHYCKKCKEIQGGGKS